MKQIGPGVGVSFRWETPTPGHKALTPAGSVSIPRVIWGHLSEQNLMLWNRPMRCETQLDGVHIGRGRCLGENNLECEIWGKLSAGKHLKEEVSRSRCSITTLPWSQSLSFEGDSDFVPCLSDLDFCVILFSLFDFYAVYFTTKTLFVHYSAAFIRRIYKFLSSHP